jgi:streptomycin 6-kinase
MPLTISEAIRAHEWALAAHIAAYAGLRAIADQEDADRWKNNRRDRAARAASPGTPTPSATPSTPERH